MKKLNVLAALITTAVLMISSNVMSAPIVDGVFDLTEWDGYYTEEDTFGVYTVGPGAGGQDFDVEYLGLYIIGDTAYFGLQTGFNLVSGTVWGLDAGDFALNIDDDPFYEYAIVVSISGGVVTCTLYAVDSWLDPTSYPDAGVWQMELGTEIFTFSGEYTDGYYGLGGELSYVVEGSFDISYLTSYIYGDDMTFHWTMECGNDVLDVTSSPVPTPEPATLLLLGTGLIGLAGFGRKKLSKK